MNTVYIIVHWSIEYVQWMWALSPPLYEQTSKLHLRAALWYVVFATLRVTHWWWWRNCNVQQHHSILLATFTTNIHHIKNNQQPLLLFVWGVHGWFKFEFKVLCCCYIEYVMYVLRVSGRVGRVGVRSYVCSFTYMSFIMDAATLISLYTGCNSYNGKMATS